MRDIISDIFIVYITGLVIISFRFLLFFIFSLDKFDWRYGKVDKWLSLVFFSVLWPLIIFRLKSLIYPMLLFKDNYGRAERDREEDQLRNHLPKCTNIIIYQQKYPADHSGIAFGEFKFDSNDVEDALLMQIKKDQRHLNQYEKNIYRWIQKRDNTKNEPSIIPDLWLQSIESIAYNLIENGTCEIKCTKCNKIYSPDNLIHDQKINKPGWNYNKVFCPELHPLFIGERCHIYSSLKNKTI